MSEIGKDFYVEPCMCTCGNRYCASNRKTIVNPNRRYSADEKRERGYRKSRAQADKKQAATLESAERRYQPWAGWELDLLERSDLTQLRVAELTGRTYKAVVAMSHRLRHDPRKQRMQDMHRLPGPSSP